MKERREKDLEEQKWKENSRDTENDDEKEDVDREGKGEVEEDREGIGNREGGRMNQSRKTETIEV